MSRNEKQRKTRQSAIKEKISGNNGTKEEKHSFFSLTGKYNRTMMLQNQVSIQKKSPSVIIIVEYFIHLSLGMTSLTDIQCNIQLLNSTITTILAAGLWDILV